MTEPCPSCNTYPPWHRIDCAEHPARKEGMRADLWEGNRRVPDAEYHKGSWRVWYKFQRDKHQRTQGKLTGANFYRGIESPTHWMPKPEGPRSAEDT